jgi:hypothetical protein
MLYWYQSLQILLKWRLRFKLNILYIRDLVLAVVKIPIAAFWVMTVCGY